MERSPREVSDGEREQTAEPLPDSSAGRKQLPNGSTAETGADEPLLTTDSSADFERRWEQIQVTFVDDPRQAVREAEALVGEVVDELSQMFTKQRSDLEHTWSRGEDVSTEDLRVALQRYRSFFRRLLAT